MKSVSKASELPATWDDLVASKNRLYSRADLQAFEGLGNYRQHYAWLEDDRGMVAAMAVQVVDFKGSQLDSYFPESNSLFVGLKNAIARSVLHQVNWRLMVVNNILVTGSKPLAVKKGSEQPHDLLNYLSDQLAKEQDADIVMFSDWYESDIQQLSDLRDYGFARFVTEDEMRVELPKDWKSFDDYLDSLQSKYRVRYRRFNKQAEHIKRRLLSADEITSHSQQLDRLFRQVEATAGFALVSPSAEYFSKMKSAFGDKFQILAYFQDDKMVAFSSFIVHDEKLETHFIGLEYDLNRQLALFPNILYDAVELGIKWEKQSVGFGRTAPEIKSTVGAEPSAMFGFLRHKNKFGQAIVNFFSAYLKPKDWTQRNPFKA